MGRTICIAWLCLALLGASAAPARAGLVINFVDTGPDITVTATGTLNTTALTENLGGFNSGAMGGLIDFGGAFRSSQAFVTRGSVYFLLSGPTFSGPSYPFFDAESPLQIQIPLTEQSGSAVGLGYTANFGGRVGVLLPTSYVSGSPIDSAGRWANREFSGLGMTDGTSFTWTWGVGASSDFLTINVGNLSVVPEPSSILLCSLGVGMMGLLARRRRRSQERENSRPAAS